MEPGDLKQFVPGELTEDGHAASGFQLGLWSVLEPFLPVEPCVVLEHTAGPRLPPTRSTFKRQHLVRQRKAEASTHPPTCQLACRGSFDSLPDFAAWAWSGLTDQTTRLCRSTCVHLEARPVRILVCWTFQLGICACQKLLMVEQVGSGGKEDGMGGSEDFGDCSSHNSDRHDQRSQRTIIRVGLPP